MDKRWQNIKNRVDKRYRIGVNNFLEWAFSQPRVSTLIRCPCKVCMNTAYKPRIEVKKDLLNCGFWDSYKVWDLHGEVLVRDENSNVVYSDEVEDDSVEEDDISEMIHDAFGLTNMGDNNNFSENNEEPNVHAEKFYKVLEDAQTELYPGCKNVSKLSFVVRLLHLKCLNHWSNKSLDALLSLFKEVLPDGSFVPDSFYEAKKVLRDLGLEYTKIDACDNDCILYWRDYANSQSCPKCGKSRWKSEENGGKKVAHKVLRHFPIKPRLQRLYMARETSKKMRWHKEECVDDGVMRHPSDSLAWKSFDERHPTFSTESRNVRLGLASDGFQPYGNMSSSHSIWPVVLVPYNLPPWDCMKDSYFMMTLLIPGPKCPGNDIDVYLQPMIEELKELWDGVETYDAHSKSNFMMRAAIMWTINDFPAYGNLSGWSTKGKLACPCCHKDTQSISLRSKLCYMGHRRFLPVNHPWRRNKKLFDGKIEKGVAPNPLTGEETLVQLQGLGNVSFGKGKKRKRKRDFLKSAYNWKKKSIFFQLPYWKTLLLRHNLDVMHIERNVSNNILSTLMNSLQTKDTVKSRYDLVDLGIREGLHPIEDGNNIWLPAACYALSLEEKSKLCNFLANMKVPDSFSSNISRCVNISDKKLHGMKCHDHHVLLQDILPIAIRGFLTKEVTEPIIELGKFFKNLCSKCLKVEDLDILEAEIATTLCKLEIVFPPAFFDVMIHLPIHLAREAKLGGPVQYRWMYPIERYLRTLKSYVRNKARPEGSIAEGYLAEECLTFCSRYLKNISTKFNKPARNDDTTTSHDEMSIFKKSRQTNCASEGIVLPHDEFKKACLYVLQNCEEVSPFMEEYTKEIERQGLVGDEMHNNDFLDWFRARIFVLSAQGQANNELKSLAVGPYPLVHRYSTYMVNGFRFHRKELNIPDDIDRAVGSGARDIVNYCGLIMRSTVSFREGDWKENVLKYGEAMWLKVKDKFEATSGVRQHVLQGFVISTMQRLFRAWKARLSTHYSRYNTDAERLSHRPEDVELEDWKYLIEYFGSEDFKAVSERNKKNREKQVTRHSCGTKSFAEVEESTRNDVTGEKEPPDKVWEIQHTRKNDNGELIWSDPFSKQVHEQLEELVVQQQSTEIEHPMTRDEILTSVLGERPGYVRGKGYGKKPPKKSRLEQANLEASVSSAMELVRQEMQAEMDRKLLEEREQMTAELKRNMEEELQKKLEDEREHVTLEVTKTIQLEVDKKIQEQFASFLRMQQDQCS